MTAEYVHGMGKEFLLMLLTFVAVITPGGGLMYVIYRLVRSRDLISVARLDAARSGAEAGAARELAEFAKETTRDALAVGQTIELVDEKLTSLTAYLVGKIDGTGAESSRRGRHAVRGADELAAITSGLLEETGGVLGEEGNQP